MSRQQDTVIDDDEETWFVEVSDDHSSLLTLYLSPLCIEEFDLSDKNFKPCPCGYQVRLNLHAEPAFVAR